MQSKKHLVYYYIHSYFALLVLPLIHHMLPTHIKKISQKSFFYQNEFVFPKNLKKLNSALTDAALPLTDSFDRHLYHAHHLHDPHHHFELHEEVRRDCSLVDVGVVSHLID